MDSKTQNKFRSTRTGYIFADNSDLAVSLQYWIQLKLFI